VTTVEVFAGAGGLALGLAAAGFKNRVLIDWDEDAVETLRLNGAAQHPLAREWSPVKMDVRGLSLSQIFNSDLALLAGGPPCQPFSQGGLHRGPLDPRDMFPSFIRLVREGAPKAFLVENVRGLAREKFATYLEYIILGLTYPTIAPRPNEGWLDHLARLEQHHTSRRRGGEELSYNVVYQVLNAADYGVPQKRERLFIVGFRNDLEIEWSFPRPTHYAALLHYEQIITGAYWDRHGITQKDGVHGKRPSPNRVERAAEKILEGAPHAMPWRTVRDALWGDDPLPNPQGNHGVPNHEFWPGARVYPGHTGSPLDEPSKTIKAGVHGVPGGENMLRFGDGSVRYLTVREAARIQTFPDDYVFPSGWTRGMKLIGNAVPVLLAKMLGVSIKGALQEAGAARATAYRERDRANPASGLRSFR